MKLSEAWLREWANPPLTREQLGEQLTMAGLEIESLTPVAEPFSGVVVGEVTKVSAHPDAERLHICEVNVGAGASLQIVCGAENVAPQLKVPVALEKAKLPQDKHITQSAIRGVHSAGMLCSAYDLGLSEDNNGLFILPSDAPLGENVWDYLQLSDYLLDIGITPNRGDCLSVMGLAKEVSALTQCQITLPPVSESTHTINDQMQIVIDAPEGCARYVGRIIRDVNINTDTPIWIKEALRRGGTRSINVVVDIVNYVMLELGQPMHAFDLDKINQSINVRWAHTNEQILLLDGSDVTLNKETLVIADKENPLAIAGVMGGLASGVTFATKNIFLESAYFDPMTIARTVRHYHLNSDSSYRFERGVDPLLQRLAIERVTQLILQIAKGQAGPITETKDEKFLPKPKHIHLRTSRIQQLLGNDIPSDMVETILHRLGFGCKRTADGWEVTVPARRFDVSIEVDLVEEIARLYGYSHIASTLPTSELSSEPVLEKKLPISRIRQALCDLGYNEVITYSFIDKNFQTTFAPEQATQELINPITAEMSVMRTTLWPGLVNTLLYNQNRQQNRVRIFETGRRFVMEGDNLRQQMMLAGLVNGAAFPKQWGVTARDVDFFDMKGDLQHVFELGNDEESFQFKIGKHPALHPGQTAEIYRGNEYLGIMGALHPQILQALKIDGEVFVFELLLDVLEKGIVPKFEALSRFPEIRRDLAIIVQNTVPVQEISYTIKEAAGELLKTLDIFDVYQGKGIKPQHKSVALTLTLQHPSRTLRDEEINDCIERVIVALNRQLNAELRG